MIWNSLNSSADARLALAVMRLFRDWRAATVESIFEYATGRLHPNCRCCCQQSSGRSLTLMKKTSKDPSLFELWVVRKAMDMSTLIFGVQALLRTNGKCFLR